MFRVAIAILTTFAAVDGARSESVQVYAAASMTDAVAALEEAYEDLYPGHDVTAVFAGSGVLARQIAQGAPADLYLSANVVWAEWLAERVPPRRVETVARNTLVWIGAAPEADGLPAGRIALADPEAVPAGRYARQALEARGLWHAAQQRMVIAANVRDALNWVVRGHAPSAVVYATDAALLPELTATPIDPALHDPITYRAAALNDAGAPFLDFLLSEEGQIILAGFGFRPPQ
ncbi:molybdate ABC transporter substrate-binding protein [Pontivivens ytuae]|nr:molybdate ABC transporter substrate-binding protein [Pontivivens ytuae]